MIQSLYPELFKAECLLEVLHGSLRNVDRFKRTGSAIEDEELHGVERRLQRPRCVVYEAFLVAAERPGALMGTSRRLAISPTATLISTRGSAMNGSRWARLTSDGSRPRFVAASEARVLAPADSVVTNGSIRSVTKVPWPCRVTTRPRLTRDLTASRTVLREALKRSRSSNSVGSWLPGASVPVSICQAQFVGNNPVHGVGHGHFSRHDNQPDLAVPRCRRISVAT